MDSPRLKRNKTRRKGLVSRTCIVKKMEGNLRQFVKKTYCRCKEVLADNFRKIPSWILKVQCLSFSPSHEREFEF